MPSHRTLVVSGALHGFVDGLQLSLPSSLARLISCIALGCRRLHVVLQHGDGGLADLMLQLLCTFELVSVLAIPVDDTERHETEGLPLPAERRFWRGRSVLGEKRGLLHTHILPVRIVIMQQLRPRVRLHPLWRPGLIEW